MANPKDEKFVRDGFWPKLTRVAAHVPFANQLLAAWYCAIDAKTPVKVKATLFGALAYFILPFDVIPDFILGLGYSDDMAVLVAAITLVRSHILPEHHAKAEAVIDEIKSGGQVSGSP
jgi:uncharacterized membrane protein YkvA (DUF1232 family)